MYAPRWNDYLIGCVSFERESRGEVYDASLRTIGAFQLVTVQRAHDDGFVVDGAKVDKVGESEANACGA